MNTLNRITLASALITVPALQASAHHAAAAFYELDKDVTMTGTVTEFRMGNPHARVYFDVTNEDGSVTNWMAEGGSRTVMLRRGWTGDELEVGDTVTIHGHPSRDGGMYVHMEHIDLPDGTTKYGEDTDPTAINDLVERRRNRD